MKKMFIVMMTLLVSFGLADMTFAKAAKPTHHHAQKKSTKQQKLDLNTVDAVTLAKKVKGIGPRRAKAIIAYRKAHGKFETINDLTKVRGISKRFLKRNQQYFQSVLTVQ